MSRIGSQMIEVGKGVTVTVDGSTVKAKGALGELAVRIPASIAVTVADGKVEVRRNGDDAQSRSLHGTTRSLIANMIQGLQKPYTKELEIQGVGFKAQAQGQNLVLSLGFSHPVNFKVPPGVTVKVVENTNIIISGPDKQQVGEVSARIRGYFPAEPYKGKGVRYKGEYVRRKAGKAVA